MADRCPICQEAMQPRFEVLILDKYHRHLLQCLGCDYLTVAGIDWLEEAYAESIAVTDTGIMMRNILFAQQIAIVLYGLFGRSGVFLDHAGGYGLFVRLMRDLGFDFSWWDRFSPNLAARGFEDDRGRRYTAVTALEFLEHVPNPLGVLREFLGDRRAEAAILTTSLYRHGTVPGSEWSYYSFETGQHISFFTERTMATMAAKLGVRYVGHGNIHVFMKRPPAWLAWYLRLACSRLRPLILGFVKARMPSLTLADHDRAMVWLREKGHE